jgi:predicted PurR-regulated permease PerM
MSGNLRPEVARPLLSVLFIAGMIAGCLWTLRPFLPSIFWATVIAVSTWPLLRWMEARLGGRRPAAAAMTLLMLSAVLLPVLVGAAFLFDNAREVAGWARGASAFSLPPLPEWVARLPWAGPRAVALWRPLTLSGAEGLFSRLEPYIGAAARWGLEQAGSAGTVLVHLLLTLFLSAMMFWKGDGAGGWVRLFARRLAGKQGDDLVLLAVRAVRGVALGVVVTSLAQALLGWTGLAVCGVPASLPLALVVFVMCVAQIGPLPVLLGAALWLFLCGAAARAAGLSAWALLISALDGVMRPALIRKGVDIPLLLVFGGVVGGLLAFGIGGLFIGPVVLAVSFTLLKAWVGDSRE